MAPKYVRTPGQIESILHQYEDEILRLRRMIDEEENEKTKMLLKEILEENIEARKKLEKFLDEKGDIFK